ncbi:YpdA family putative bacillithiol disulfide reductase [Priestia koreensis]|uniref:YpdA family putative bacillithiol disulfide reductase n=1 Tax=Priestia koreensis TaxID=284581 RepID=UPI003D04F757
MKDVVIIGAGPSGLAAAIEAHKLNLNYVVIEKGCIVNSISKFPTYVTLFGPAEDFEIGSVPFSLKYGPPTKHDAMRYYYKASKFFDLKINQYEEVKKVIEQTENHEGSFKIITSKDTYQAKNVVFATGFVDNPKSMGIEGENLDKVKSLFTESHHYANQHVVVIGTGHSGLEAIMDLLTVDAKVTVVHRGQNLTYTPKRWMLAEVRKAIDENKVDAYFNSKVVKIEEDAVVIETPEDMITIKNDFVLKLIGFHPNYSMMKELGVSFCSELDKPSYDEDTFETNVNGLYCCGVMAGGKDVNKFTISDSRYHGQKIMKHIHEKLTKHLNGGKKIESFSY